MTSPNEGFKSVICTKNVFQYQLWSGFCGLDGAEELVCTFVLRYSHKSPSPAYRVTRGLQSHMKRFKCFVCVIDADLMWAAQRGHCSTFSRLLCVCVCDFCHLCALEHHFLLCVSSTRLLSLFVLPVYQSPKNIVHHQICDLWQLYYSTGHEKPRWSISHDD